MSSLNVRVLQAESVDRTLDFSLRSGSAFPVLRIIRNEADPQYRLDHWLKAGASKDIFKIPQSQLGLALLIEYLCW